METLLDTAAVTLVSFQLQSTQPIGFRSESAGKNALRTLESAQTKARPTKPGLMCAGLMRMANVTGSRLLRLSHPGTASFAHCILYLAQDEHEKARIATEVSTLV